MPYMNKAIIRGVSKQYWSLVNQDSRSVTGVPRRNKLCALMLEQNLAQVD